MEWAHGISYFAGGAFLANAVPHFVSGAMGRPFQSPFATPPGRDLSSPTVNVMWGVFNLALAYALLCHVGHFALRAAGHAAVAGSGLLLAGVMLARAFGRLHGGTTPGTS